MAFFIKGSSTMAKFEVTIYNKQVREKLADGEHHDHYTDDWADFRYVEILALNEGQARARIMERHPQDRGFVIDNIVLVKESEDE